MDQSHNIRKYNQVKLRESTHKKGHYQITRTYYLAPITWAFTLSIEFTLSYLLYWSFDKYVDLSSDQSQSVAADSEKYLVLSVGALIICVVLIISNFICLCVSLPKNYYWVCAFYRISGSRFIPSNVYMHTPSPSPSSNPSSNPSPSPSNSASPANLVVSSSSPKIPKSVSFVLP